MDLSTYTSTELAETMHSIDTAMVAATPERRAELETQRGILAADLLARGGTR